MVLENCQSSPRAFFISLVFFYDLLSYKMKFLLREISWNFNTSRYATGCSFSTTAIVNKALSRRFGAANNETNQRFNGARRVTAYQKIYVTEQVACTNSNGNMWYTVVSRCAVPHVSPLGPLWRSPRETLLVTISEWSRALFNTLIRFTIRDSVCTSVFVHNYCPRHVFRAIFIGTLSAWRSLSFFFSPARRTNNRFLFLVLFVPFSLPPSWIFQSRFRHCWLS